MLVYCGGVDKRALNNRDLRLTLVEMRVGQNMSRLLLRDVEGQKRVEIDDNRVSLCLKACSFIISKEYMD